MEEHLHKQDVEHADGETHAHKILRLGLKHSDVLLTCASSTSRWFRKELYYLQSVGLRCSTAAHAACFANAGSHKSRAASQALTPICQGLLSSTVRAGNELLGLLPLSWGTPARWPRAAKQRQKLHAQRRTQIEVQRQSQACACKCKCPPPSTPPPSPIVHALCHAPLSAKNRHMERG
jgi:hypothetical protein